MVKELIAPRQLSEQAPFTPGQLTILQLLVDGISRVEEMAARLSISQVAIRDRKSRIAHLMGEDCVPRGLSKAIAKAISCSLLDTSKLPGDPPESLSGQQVTFLDLMCRDFSSKEIAQALHLSAPEVRRLRGNTYKIIGVHSQYQVVAWVAQVVKESKRVGLL